MLNTLVHDKPVSMGSQWVVFVPTVVYGRQSCIGGIPSIVSVAVFLPLNVRLSQFCKLAKRLHLNLRIG